MLTFKSPRKTAPGFTLVETLVASLILAIGAVVICSLGYRCTTNTRRGMEYEQAYRLLDESLEKVLTADIAELAKKQTMEGDFGERYPLYKYLLYIEPTPHNGLYEVTATVTWQVNTQQYSVKTTTLLCDF